MTIKLDLNQQALLKSMEKWLKNFDLASKGEEIDIGPETCALCQLYNNQWSVPACIGCPVYEKTGRKHCSETPYNEVSKYRCDLRLLAQDKAHPSIIANRRKDLIDACAAEYTFLATLFCDPYLGEF